MSKETAYNIYIENKRRSLKRVAFTIDETSCQLKTRQKCSKTLLWSFINCITPIRENPIIWYFKWKLRLFLIYVSILRPKFGHVGPDRSLEILIPAVSLKSQPKSPNPSLQAKISAPRPQPQSIDPNLTQMAQVRNQSSKAPNQSALLKSVTDRRT